MTLADGWREPPPPYRAPNSTEEAALLQLIAVTSHRRLPPRAVLPLGSDRVLHAWQRVLRKAEDWNLPPLMTIDRLTQASVRGLEPDW